VIVDMQTGYLVKNADEAVEAVGKIDRIERAACRRRVEENFTIDKMVAGYEKVYAEIFRLEARKE
jgi:glycosyltransferase involved in cell wall biosynthesis